MMQQSLLEEIRELQTRVEKQDQRIARLERQLQAQNLRELPCLRCDQGDLVRDDDRLHCPVCEYACPL